MSPASNRIWNDEVVNTDPPFHMYNCHSATGVCWSYFQIHWQVLGGEWGWLNLNSTHKKVQLMTPHSSQHTRHPTTKALVSGRPKARKRIKMHNYTPEKFIRNLNISPIEIRKKTHPNEPATPPWLWRLQNVFFFLPQNVVVLVSFLDLPSLKLTYPPENGTSQKERIVFQPPTIHLQGRLL